MLLSRRKRCAILFDEVEDVFPWEDRAFFGTMGNVSESKAAMNRLMDENVVPAIWVCNHADHIDSAYLRRFDFVLELRTPNRAARRRILDKYLVGTQTSDRWRERMAGFEDLAPAVIEKAVKLVDHLNEQDPNRNERVLEKTIGNTLSVMGQRRKPPRLASSETRYRLDLVNASEDLSELIHGMRNATQGRFCLYGPPGTGKTAFGHHLAHELDKPVIARSASDLLSAWLGETEKKVARAFRQAEETGSILLLDEVDGFLRDRSGQRAIDADGKLRRNLQCFHQSRR
jgi:SpoVK/Ycf46/Vps4 family AAA+-type ATPase